MRAGAVISTTPRRLSPVSFQDEGLDGAPSFTVRARTSTDEVPRPPHRRPALVRAASSNARQRDSCESPASARAGPDRHRL